MSRKLPSRFWSSQVWLRRKALLKDPALWLSLGLAIAICALAPHVPFSQLPIEKLAGAGLSFSALSLGACVAGSTLALGIPGEARLERWSKIQREGKPFSALSDLVFTFAWAAMAQVAVILVSFAAYVFGWNTIIFPSNAALSHIVALLGSMWICFYALFALTAVIRSLVQVAGAIIREEAGPENRAK